MPKLSFNTASPISRCPARPGVSSSAAGRGNGLAGVTPWRSHTRGGAGWD